MFGSSASPIDCQRSLDQLFMYAFYNPSAGQDPFADQPCHYLAWEDAAKQASEFISQLNTTEKIGLVTGSYGLSTLPCVGTIAAIERLNFTGLCLSDGPSGYGRSDGVSVFPSGITVAATWDKRLMYERGVALGEEFRGKGSHIFLG